MSPRPARTARLAPLLLVAACAIGDDQLPKPENLPAEWLVDRLRVLAIQAEPPEAAVGQEVRFSALLVDPFEEVGGVIWLACPSETDLDLGCPLDPSLDFANATPEELAAAGFVGFEPLVPPRYTPGPELFEGKTEFEQLDGVQVVVQMAAVPPELLSGDLGDDGFDPANLEAGYKRLIVSTNPQPNQNPTIAALSFDGVELDPTGVVEVDPGQEYLVAARLTTDSAETYDYTNAEGVTETRSEEPYLKWYTSGGSLRESLTLFGFFDVPWVAPPRGSPTTEGTIWAVVRDRRGGMSWIAQRWRVRP